MNDWPQGSGEMAERMRAHDWTATPLGPSDSWSDRLKILVELMLASPLVATLALTPDRLLLYNDTASQLYGSHHPGALGRPLADTFPIAYAVVAPLYDRVFAGESVQVREQPLAVGGDDSGEVFDAYLTPVYAADGTVFGAHMVGLEIGSRVRGEAARKQAEIALRESEERQSFLLRLSDELRPIVDPIQVQELAARSIGVRLHANLVHYAETSGDTLVIRHSWACGLRPMVGRFPWLDFGERLHEGFGAGRTMVSFDVSHDPEITDVERKALADISIAAYIAVPLLNDGKWVGTFAVHSMTSRVWKPAEVQLVQEVAERMWAAVERARAETALRDLEQRQRTVLEGIPQLVWRSLDGGDWTWASPQWTTFTGLSNEESRHLVWERAVHPDDLERTNLAWQQATSRGLLDVEHRLRRASDGAWIWHHTRSLPLRDQDGRVLEWLGTCTDIQEEKQAEAALAESEERFRVFVDNVREYALVRTDAKGLITSWNPGAERLFGYTGEEVLHKPFQLLLTAADASGGVLDRELELVQWKRRSHDARWVQRKDGSTFWADWITEAITDDDGALIGTTKVMRDETDRRAADELKRQSAEFTENSLREKEELLKEVHHRVKNNLQVIISLLSLQARQIDDEQVLTLFEESRNRVQSIAAIHELIYRADSFATIVLADYARQLVPDLVRFYGLENRVRAEITGDGAALELERAVPYGMLLNELVSNACKHAYIGRTTGKLVVSFTDDGNEVEMAVSDDGPGLPPGFDYGQATSLGLRLVHGLVRQLDGALSIETGAGTVVKVRFSLHDGAEADA